MPKPVFHDGSKNLIGNYSAGLRIYCADRENMMWERPKAFAAGKLSLLSGGYCSPW